VAVDPFLATRQPPLSARPHIKFLAPCACQLQQADRRICFQEYLDQAEDRIGRATTAEISEPHSCYSTFLRSTTQRSLLNPDHKVPPCYETDSRGRSTHFPPIIRPLETWTYNAAARKSLQQVSYVVELPCSVSGWAQLAGVVAP
jgi:hypothetical protein